MNQFQFIFSKGQTTTTHSERIQGGIDAIIRSKPIQRVIARLAQKNAEARRDIDRLADALLASMQKTSGIDVDGIKKQLRKTWAKEAYSPYAGFPALNTDTAYPNVPPKEPNPEVKKLKQRVKAFAPDTLKNRMPEAAAQTAGTLAPTAANTANKAFKMPLPWYARSGLGLLGAGSRAYANNNDSASHEAVRLAMNYPSVAADVNKITDAVVQTNAAKVLPWLSKPLSEDVKRVGTQGQGYYNAINTVAKDKNFAQPELNTVVGQVASPALAASPMLPGGAGTAGALANTAYMVLNASRLGNLGASVKSDLHDIAKGEFVPDVGFNSEMAGNYFFNPATQIHGQYIADIPVKSKAYQEYLASQKQKAEERTREAEREAARKNTWFGSLADAFTGVGNLAVGR